MPAKFEKCVRDGGRVRTIKPKGKESKTYIHVCYPKGGGLACVWRSEETQEKG